MPTNDISSNQYISEKISRRKLYGALKYKLTGNSIILRIGFCLSSGSQSRNIIIEKIDKHFDFKRKLKKLWNMKVMVIPTVVDFLGTILKFLEKYSGY